jgi:hypothetical protein
MGREKMKRNRKKGGEYPETKQFAPKMSTSRRLSVN